MQTTGQLINSQGKRIEFFGDDKSIPIYTTMTLYSDADVERMVNQTLLGHMNEDGRFKTFKVTTVEIDAVQLKADLCDRALKISTNDPLWTCVVCEGKFPLKDMADDDVCKSCESAMHEEKGI